MKTQTLKKTFVIVTVSDRVADLNILLESIICRPKFNDYDINILMQDYADKKDGIIQTERITNLFIVPERLGCNAARIMLLNKLNYDVYINLDDDMEFTDYTDFNRVIKKVCEKETGFIIINWARMADGAFRWMHSLIALHVKPMKKTKKNGGSNDY